MDFHVASNEMSKIIEVSLWWLEMPSRNEALGTTCFGTTSGKAPLARQDLRGELSFQNNFFRTF